MPAAGGTVAQASVDPATTPPTCKWTDSLTVSPAILATSGLHRMRTRVVMDQPSDVVSGLLAVLACLSLEAALLDTLAPMHCTPA